MSLKIVSLRLVSGVLELQLWYTCHCKEAQSLYACEYYQIGVCVACSHEVVQEAMLSARHTLQHIKQTLELVSKLAVGVSG